ncbi:hypothetical protein NC652_041131 [Populus alba x Populus x berolinensis]|nr:hypothetical protein NC652_041131 [Populus alba x Populus x berolinensis]
MAPEKLAEFDELGNYRKLFMPVHDTLKSDSLLIMELLLIDLIYMQMNKKLSRIMANRQSAARLKERKARYHMYPNLKEKSIPTYTILEGYIKSDY